MLKALFLLLMNLALAAMATAQMNLVPNGGFEDTVDCSIPVQCTLLKAASWRNPTPSTPDVWDCDLGRACGYVMDTLTPGPVGVQSAFPGQRFAGCLIWDGPEAPVRDYAMVRLQTPLMPGYTYVVSLNYSRADGYMYAVDHIGIWFGMDSLGSSSPFRLEVEPQVRLRSPWSSHLLEQDDWETISDTLVANGGEQWMVIGLFDVDEEVDAIVANAGSIAPNAYYFFDDVSVHPLEDVGIADEVRTAWWDGTRINFVGTYIGGASVITLWDAAGRMLERYSAPIQEGSSIPIGTDLRPGVYVAQFQTQGVFIRFKFVKEEGGL